MTSCASAAAPRSNRRRKAPFHCPSSCSLNWRRGIRRHRPVGLGLPPAPRHPEPGAPASPVAGRRRPAPARGGPTPLIGAAGRRWWSALVVGAVATSGTAGPEALAEGCADVGGAARGAADAAVAALPVVLVRRTPVSAAAELPRAPSRRRRIRRGTALPRREQRDAQRWREHSRTTGTATGTRRCPIRLGRGFAHDGFLSFINEGMIDAAQASDRHSPFPPRTP